MKKTTRAGRDGRKLLRTLAAGHQSSTRSVELAVAAGQVIARRTALGVAALTDPAGVDHAEMARLIPEKAIAFAEAAMICMQRSGEMTQRMTRFAMAESAAAMSAAGALAGCRDPITAASVQSRFAVGLYWRAVSQAIAVGALAAQAYGELVAPVHRAATQNARRLGSGR